MDGDISFAGWTLTGLQSGWCHQLCRVDVDRFAQWMVTSTLHGGR